MMGFVWCGDVLAHVAGVPVEEMLGASPGAVMLVSGLGAWWRARRSRLRSPN